MQIEMGMPLTLVDAKGLKKYGLTKNMPGWCNSSVTLEGDGEYVMFQPEGTKQFYWIGADRVEIDETRLPKLEE